jgi:hypothetical protein
MPVRPNAAKFQEEQSLRRFQSTGKSIRSSSVGNCLLQCRTRGCQKNLTRKDSDPISGKECEIGYKKSANQHPGSQKSGSGTEMEYNLASGDG